MTGPLCRSAVEWAWVGARAASISSVTTYRSSCERSWPPYFFGHVMPIQPLAPTLRLNSREKDPFPPSGENVPASISSRRKARTPSRNPLASGGSSTGSKRKLKLICASRSCGDEGPEPVGAMLSDHPPEARGPHRLVAELLAPGPQPARSMVQRVL